MNMNEKLLYICLIISFLNWFYVRLGGTGSLILLRAVPVPSCNPWVPQDFPSVGLILARDIYAAASLLCRSQLVEIYTTMDRLEEFSKPIKRAIETHPLYTVVALSLGLSVYRWNTNRVG